MKRIVIVLGLLSCVACAAQPKPVAHPATGEALIARALSYARGGNDMAAEQYLLLSQVAGAPEPRVVRELVKVCVGAGRLEHAVHHATTYVERHPEDRQMRHALASIYFAKGDSVLARSELEQLVHEWPDAAESHFLLALILRERDIASARRSMESYLALAPSGEHASEARAWMKRTESFPAASKRRVR